MKVIDLLNQIARGDEMPKTIKVKGVNYIWTYEKAIKSYKNCDFYELLRYLTENLTLNAVLNKEVEVLEEN